MAHLRRKKDNYYAEFYDPARQPRRKWVTLRTKNRLIARQRLSEFERKEAMDIYDPWQDPAPSAGVSVREAIDRFIKVRRGRGLREKTLHNYRSTLDLFERRLPAALLIDDVDAGHIRDYLGRDGLSRTTRDTYYRQLRTFFRWCEEEGLVSTSPIEPVVRPGRPAKQASYLMPDEVERIIDTVRDDAASNAEFVQEGEVLWLVDVIRFAVYTGLRLGEICDLRWGAVNLDSGFLTVRGTESFDTKSGDEDRIPIVDGARGVLERRRQERQAETYSEHVFRGVRGGPLYPNYVSARFRHYRKLAGLPEEISFHSLRHTCASWLAMRGVSMRIVQAMLRHSTIDVTQRYAHLAPDAIKDPVEEAFAGVGS